MAKNGDIANWMIPVSQIDLIVFIPCLVELFVPTLQTFKGGITNTI